jgi:hypothetical protein
MQVEVLVRPDLPKVHKEEIKNRLDSTILTENTHFFRTDKQGEGDHPLNQYLDRYGIKFRPLNEGELRDILEHNGWKWISNKDEIGKSNIWFRNGVIPCKNLNHLRAGVDYFFEAEEIADYFNTLPVDERLPVVGNFL